MLYRTKNPAAPIHWHQPRSLSHFFLISLFLIGIQGCAVQTEAQPEHADQHASEEADRSVVVMGPEDGDHLWVFAENKDKLGSGGEFHIYVDPERQPEALASFAKYGIGVGGVLPMHRHDKTEEIAYFISGEGIVQTHEDDSPREMPVGAGYVWYTPPGAWHAVTNTGQEPLTLVFATIPNEKQGLLSFFRRIGTRPGVEGTPLGPEEFGRLAAEHDLILRPPSADE